MPGSFSEDTPHEDALRRRYRRTVWVVRFAPLTGLLLALALVGVLGLVVAVPIEFDAPAIVVMPAAMIVLYLFLYRIVPRFKDRMEDVVEERDALRKKLGESEFLQ